MTDIAAIGLTDKIGVGVYVGNHLGEPFHTRAGPLLRTVGYPTDVIKTNMRWGTWK